MRRMRWTGHVARMERGKVHTVFLWRNLSAKENLADKDIDGRII
jgi:hypothetical protein